MSPNELSYSESINNDEYIQRAINEGREIIREFMNNDIVQFAPGKETDLNSPHMDPIFFSTYTSAVERAIEFKHSI